MLLESVKLSCKSHMSKPDLRALPSVDRLAASLNGVGSSAWVRTRAAQRAIEEFRAVAALGGPVVAGEVRQRATDIAARLAAPAPSPVINMSGVVLHTGLGRARLAPSALEALQATLAGHAAVELDLDSGQRGDRQLWVRDLLHELTGAEDCLVVNNCAGAVLLALSAQCQGREVVLSRGQMVEIGGSFRMPEIVAASGCRLVEVGCTNKTRLSDYAKVWGDETSAILRCHPSNFRVVGFTEEPTARELASLAHDKGGLLIDDVGHGCVTDTTTYGLPRERTLREAVADGADIVLASGDKLLGGPQCGLVLGRSDLVRRIATHPLARALRVDKATIAALAATLRLYLEGREAEVPLWQTCAVSAQQTRRDSQALVKAFPGKAVVAPALTEIGGGSMPGTGLSGFRAGLRAQDAASLALRLRKAPVPVIGRIEDGLVWLDPRTADKQEVKAVCRFLSEMNHD